MPEYRYVYSVLTRETHLPKGLVGIDGGSLYAISCGDLVAAAGTVTRAKILPTTENVLRHEAIVEAVHREGASVPVRFGTVLPDTDAVRETLAAHREQLTKDIACVGDKQEMGVIVLWSQSEADSDGLAAEDTRQDDDEGASQQHHSGTRYMLARFREYKREAELRDKATSIQWDVDGVLRIHTLDSKHSVLPTPGIAVRASYLIEPGQIGSFTLAFDELRRQRSDLRMLLTGPWPPYNFVTLVRGEVCGAAPGSDQG